MPSYGDLDDPLVARLFRGLEIDRKAAFDGFLEVLEQLFEAFPLGRTTRDRRHFGPVPTFFGVMHDDFELHLGSPCTPPSYQDPGRAMRSQQETGQPVGGDVSSNNPLTDSVVTFSATVADYVGNRSAPAEITVTISTSLNLLPIAQSRCRAPNPFSRHRNFRASSDSGTTWEAATNSFTARE